MSILYDSEKRLFTLETRCSSYQMMADAHGVLLHTWFGAPLGGADMSGLIDRTGRGGSGTPGDVMPDRSYSLDHLPQEYPTDGTGDYRTAALRIRWPNGAAGCDLRYVSHEIRRGKYALEGLPALFSGAGDAETLEITLRDRHAELYVHLLYGVLPESGLLTRAARIENRTGAPVTLLRAASASYDLGPGGFTLLHLYGRPTMERQAERLSLPHGIFELKSSRGESSHQHNPFAVLADPGTDEDHGGCRGFALVYSGGFFLRAEVDQTDETRLSLGLDDEDFSWRLGDGESFVSPEVCAAYSGEGLTALSHLFQRGFLRHLVRSPWKSKMRPVVINSWEAAYFDFDGDSLVSLARSAAALGLDLMVLDDGWFGARSDDTAGLGDWKPNEKKLGGTMGRLSRRIGAEGVSFGLWFEPEMVNEDSDLFRAHPDWALRIPGRDPVRSRTQLVLDFSREDVRRSIEAQLFSVLDSSDISYVKWDMNRSLSDVYSAELPPERQGEVRHRYVLGLYRVMEDLLARYPDLLLEGCSGGGGRFDAGMLYYAPQIWGSDNTDAVARLKIHYGTSFCYPMSALSAHVSACPNHLDCRTTPFRTRCICAMQGTFGFELDPASLTEDEKRQVREETAFFHEHWRLFQLGDYYRLSDPMSGGRWTAWEYAEPSGREACLSVVFTDLESNAPSARLRWKGLVPGGGYAVSLDGAAMGTFSGEQLLKGGVLLPRPTENYASFRYFASRLS